MKDIPVFTSEYGVASLIFKEIPYRQEAYIVIQSSVQPKQLLEECVSFCRMVGAEKIYARGHEFVEQYPLHSMIYEMRGSVAVDESKVESLWPVTEETVTQWRQTLNERLKDIDHAQTLEKRDEKQILDRGGAYFVHRNGQLLGAGWIADEELLLIASCQKGAGERVLHTLLSVSCPEQLRLQVVSSNEKALRFYERMGFVKTSEVYRWHRVL